MNIFSAIKNSWHRRQAQKLTRPELAHMFTAPHTNSDGMFDEWVSLDCEMTGLNPKTDHILSVACIKIHTTASGIQINSGDGLNLVCRPPVMPTADNIIIHGIRPSDVEHGMSYDDMLSMLLPFIGNRPIIGFCPHIDIKFLNILSKKYMGTPLPNSVIDIRTLHNRKTGNRTQGIAHHGQTFHSILKYYNIPLLPEHDAYNDSLMTAMAFVHLR